ncbi:non-ribosomal peptide synthetase [Streptomyces pinistramenti]|uniref:non-ribosomal peptide synthetase n=1 Tax=Streptomyces pinistramenti TaxID=2884812 RepID=UPI001D088190|nr:non-ribosomal peptide synthetase [Streptomyces pinistramenti]MCB5906083.1 amino acid adenylation domain-containing protein [Streptomyces pinistramenti]
MTADAPGTPASPAAAGLAAAVLAGVRRAPHAPAVVDGGPALDRAGLDRLSAAVAAALRRHGIRPGQAVAVCLPRSWQLVCVLLGVLRTGAVVVPLDAQSPPERRAHILRDAGAMVLVHDAAPDEALPTAVTQLTSSALLAAADAPGGLPDRPAEAPPAPSDGPPVAVLFYTSGSTGRPKGVEVRDAGVLRLARDGYLDLVEGARYACLSNPAFDALSFEVWVPLLTGGCCVILADEDVQTPDALAAALRREDVDTLFVTTALFNAVTHEVPDCFSSVRQVLIGGEQLNARAVSRWYRHNAATSATRLFNVYGPTESTTFALCHPIPRDFDGDVVPLGEALPGTGTLLVADGTRPARPGEAAELYLSGDGLAAGYRNLPDETARRFVTLPWHDAGRTRWYRTGDLVRRDGAGLLTYLGRADRQVKVRGFRIEPGEVERCLESHPKVRQAYVCTRRDTAGAGELLAYLVPDGELSFERFERHLAAGLPAYMRPHHLHLVDALPRTANGKIDEDALRSRGVRPWRPAGGTDTGTTPWQRELLDLAGDVLGATDLRLDDRWIPLGGDSLKALRLRFEVRRRYGCDVPQSLVIGSDLGALAAAVAAGRAAGDRVHPPLPAPVAGRDSAPATCEQQRLWLLQQRAPQSRAYDVPLAFRIRGDLDVPALRRALRRLVARHPALRTAFEATSGGLVQRVSEPYDPWRQIVTDDGEGEEAAARQLARDPFDLADPRMLRAGLLPRDGGGTLLLHLHHIAVDGWSLNVLFHDLSTGYAAALRDGEDPAAERPQDGTPTPLDLALWQADWHTHDAYRTQRAELRAYYDGLEPPSPALEPLHTANRPTARLVRTSLDPVRRTALDRLTAELGLTRFHVLLSAYAWSLYGVTGQARPVIAAPVAGRPLPDFESSVGMFANTVLLPVSLDPAAELSDQIRMLSTAVQTVLDRQDVGLADVLDGRGVRTGGTPFDFLFVLENTDFGALALQDCDSRPEFLQPTEAKCPLTLSVVEHENGFDCLWEYADDHFDPADIEALADLFVQGLDRLAAGGTGTLADVVAPYRRALAGPGLGTPATPAFATVADGFARQVRRAPHAPAVTHGDRTLSYRELDAQAAALAAELRARYPLPAADAPACVALHLPPSVEHVVALLALARLNVTAVPLDPSYPPALLRQVLGRIEPLCVLLPPGEESAIDAVAGPDLPRHPVTLPQHPPAPQDPEPHQGLRPLYILFTSGSTGTPKGVRVPDRTLCNLLSWQAEEGGLGGPAVTQQFSMLSFDVSFQEIFTTLCGGGLLHLIRPGWRQDVPALLEQLEAAAVERVFLPYVALNLLAEHGVRLGRYPSRLREVVTAGEQLVCTDAIRRWFAGLSGARLCNHYGPTETHVVSGLCLDGDPARWPDRPAIGRPVANAHLRVADEDGQPLPPGRTGHLLIGGPMAAPCYVGDDALNRTRFTADGESGTFYRSGDLARFDRQGLLHYAGRDDEQVKVSGHRVELGQIEAALLRHPRIVQAVVVLDGAQLVACLQWRDGAAPPTGLDTHLAALLPAHLRVHRFRRLHTLPRTPSGKLDRRAALAASTEEAGAAAGTEQAPVLPAHEARLSELFAEATGRSVAPEQRFFDVGATSLDLMRFHLRCVAEPDLDFTIPDLFEHVTIRALGRFLDGRSRAAGEEAPAAAVSVTPSAWNEPIAVIGMAVRLPGARDLGAFWELVESGARGIEHFDAPDGTVGARSQMDGLLDFDPGHFGISRQEARLMDPQQRHLLMSCVEALAHAGIADPAVRRVGLVAGCGENTYFQEMLREGDPAALPDSFQLALHHDKDFLATKAAYHLDLTGPALTVQAACASSLAGVHVAAGLLRQGDADVMLAGGVLVDTRLSDGYTYRPQHIFSPDGHCRPFSDDAGGTIGASGVGVVVLKRLSQARRDGDTVYAVVTGSALNNDGADKMSYSAPSLAGQREVIRTALERSGRSSADLGYVEAHGTATRLGDPVEVGALRQAFGLTESGRCALSSVKSQIGHLGAAAGVVGLVRAALAVHHGLIPPNVGFRRLNPHIGDDPAPFHIPAGSAPWPSGRPRVAAVSSFGIGGTNAHLILEQGAPAGPAAGPDTVPCLVLSSRSAAGLRAEATRIAAYLSARPDSYEQVLRHLQAGRPAHRWRAAAVCPDAASAVAWLRTATGTQVTPGDQAPLGTDRPFAPDLAPERLAAAWTAGHPVRWPAGGAQAPWDFPPPAFDLSAHDFPRPAPGTPDGPSDGAHRLPADRWLHQPAWTRLKRAHTRTDQASSRTLVIMTATPAEAADWHGLAPAYGRVVRVLAGDSFARCADDVYTVDPADAASLGLLLRALREAAPAGLDWLHALPLSVRGEVGDTALARARWACLDTPAALVRALAEHAEHAEAAGPARVWWLSHRAQPVEGAVERPELGLLAGAVDVPRQETGLATCWLDLPTPRPAHWAAALVSVLADEHGEDADPPPRRLALRSGYWWHATPQPVAAPAPQSCRPVGAGARWLVLGGTGGIGSSIAAHLLETTDCHVVLVSRRANLPTALVRWADRVELLAADLAEEPPERVRARIEQDGLRIDGIVHAAGVASGALLVRRDADAMRHGTAAKLHGALLMEGLIATHRPAYAVYCSSMSAWYGGTGQFDYAAANGLLDAFAQYRPGPSDDTVRIAVDWDIWSDVGMAGDALPHDTRHRAHLTVGLTADEGRRVFADALRRQLPHLLVSTTDLDHARSFYEPAGPAPAPATATATAETTNPGPAPGALPTAAELTGLLCRLLGADSLDPSSSLYDLGADSLTFLELITDLHDRYGIELELSRFSHRVSLDEIRAHLHAAARTEAPGDDPVRLEIWQAGTGRDVLCLVHPVGGDIQAYRPLVTALDPRLTVCLIADPALHDPGLPPWPLTERAARYHAALEARFPHGTWRRRLAGWSFGAWVALSMAAAAEAETAPVDHVYLLDPPPPGAGPVLGGYDEQQIRTVFAHELARQDTGRPLGDEAQQYADRLTRCCRANLHSMADHRLPRLARTASTLWLAGLPTPGLPVPGSPDVQAAAWEALLPRPSSLHHLETSHYDLVRPPQVKHVSEAVNADTPRTDGR